VLYALHQVGVYLEKEMNSINAGGIKNLQDNAIQFLIYGLHWEHPVEVLNLTI